MVSLKRLQDLHDRATPVGWDTVPTSSGGVLLKRGKEYPLAERHPQTHLQVVPAVDGNLMAEMRNALPELLSEIATLVQALADLRVDANRLCDRNLGGTYEEDCRRSIARADAVLREHRPRMKGLDDPNATVLVFTGDETDAELDATAKVLEHELGARESVTDEK